MNKKIKPFLISTVGMILFTLTINIFSWKNVLVTGGFPGYALVLNYLTGVSIGSSLFFANTVLILLTFFILGKTAGIKGIYGYILVSVTADLWRKVLGLSQAEIPFINQLIAVVLQGFFSSFCIAFVISNKYSFGNYSTMHPLFNNFVKVSAPVFFFACDVILSLLTIIFFGWQKGFLVLVNSAVFYFMFKFALSKMNKIFN